MQVLPKLAIAAALILALPACGHAEPGAALPPSVTRTDGLPSLAPMLEQVLPGVVSIAVEGHVTLQENPLLADPFFRHFFGVPDGMEGLEQAFTAAGSGVIVDPDEGYILTNNHLIEEAESITVLLADGRRFPADTVGTDPVTDIAVLRISAQGLTGLELGDSDALHVGDYVAAVGNPFGLAQTVTSGIVSALGRSGLGFGGFENFIQTDASINPGNSGGALLTLDGRLVGINSAILGARGNIGIGFAIPINTARAAMKELIAHGTVRRGSLGVLIQEVTPELALAFGLPPRQTGALIAHVKPGSPAELAGLRPGDVVIAADGLPIRDVADLRRIVGMAVIGQRLTLTVLRDGRERQMEAELAALQQLTAPPSAIRYLDGVGLAPLNGAGAQEMRRGGQDGSGVLVIQVEPTAPAGRAGLRPGDIIIGADQKPVSSVAELKASAAAAEDGLLLRVRRADGSLFLFIP